MMGLVMGGLITLVLLLCVSLLVLLTAYARLQRVSAELLEYLLEHRARRGEPLVIRKARTADRRPGRDA